MTSMAKDPKQHPLLRNLQFSPIKEGEEQYVVLWDPTVTYTSPDATGSQRPAARRRAMRPSAELLFYHPAFRR